MSVMSSLMVTFGVRDEGVREDIHVLDETLQSIRGRLDDIKSSQAFSNLIQSLNLGVLSNFTDTLGRIGDELNDQVELSSSFASSYAEAEKSLQATAATMDLTNSEMQRMRRETSFFESLQMDSQEVQNTWARMHDSGLDLNELGFQNLQEFMKFTEVAGVEGPKVVRMLERMTTQFGFTQEQARGMMDRVLEVGRTFDVGAEFMQAMPERLTAVQEHFSKVFETASPDRIQAMTESTFMLAGALEEAGMSSDEALSQASSMFETLSDQSQQLDEMLMGAAQDAPDFMRKQLMALGEVNISERPMEFVRQLRSQYKRAQETGRGLRTFQNILNQLPSGVSTLVTSSIPGLNKKLSQARKNMRSAAGAANELAEAHRTTRTAQEQFQRQEEQFNAELIRMSNNMGVTESLLELQGEAYDRLSNRVGRYLSLSEEATTDTRILGQRVKTTSGELTTMGMAVQGATSAWVAYRSAGIRGATIALVDFAEEHGIVNEELAESKGMVGSLLGTLSEGLPEILTMVSAMSVAGIPGLGLLGPLLPVMLFGGGAIALESAWQGGISGFLEDAKSFLGEKLPILRQQIVSGINDMIAGLPRLADQVGEATDPVIAFFSNLFAGVDWGRLREVAGEVGGEMVSGIAGILERVPWREGAEAALSMAGQALVFIGEELGPPILRGLKDAAFGAFDALWEWVTSADSSVYEKAKTAGTGLGGALMAGLALAPGATVGLAANLGKGITSIIGGAAKTLKPLAATAGQKLKPIGKGAARKLKGAYSKVGGAKGIAKGYGMLASAVVGVTSAVETAKVVNAAYQGDLKKTQEAGESAFMGILDAVNMVTLSIPEQIGSALGITRGHVKMFYHWLGLKTDQAIDFWGTLFGQMPTMGRIVLNRLKSDVAGFLGWMLNTFAEGMDKLKTPINTIAGVFKLSFLNIKLMAKEFVAFLFRNMSGLYDKMLGLFQMVVPKVNTLAQSLGLGGFDDQTMQALQQMNMEDITKKMGVDKKSMRKFRKNVRGNYRTAAEEGFAAVTRTAQNLSSNVRMMGASFKDIGARAGRRAQRLHGRAMRSFDDMRRRNRQAQRQYQRQVRQMGQQGGGGGGAAPEQPEGGGDEGVRVPMAGGGGTPADSTAAVAKVNRQGFLQLTGRIDSLDSNMGDAVEELKRIRQETEGGRDEGASPASPEVNM